MASLWANLGWTQNWSTGGMMWADFAKATRPFTDTNNNLIALDSYGWPTGAWHWGILDGSIPSWLPTNGYQLRFRDGHNGGQTLSSNGCSIVGLTAKDGNGYRTATVNLTGSNISIDGSDAVQDVSLMRPGHTRGVDYFNKAFTQSPAVVPFTGWRPMQTFGPGLSLWGAAGNAVDYSRDTTWASRTKPTAGYAYNGCAIEDLILFANLTGRDIWACIPHLTTSDYCTKMAQAFKYGTDAATGLPLTALTTHDPSTWTPAAVTYTAGVPSGWWPGLAPGRRVYPEFTNEVWNYLGAWANAQGSAEISSGDPAHLNYDSSGTQQQDRWVMWKACVISTLWRAVWGDAAMGTTVFPVFATQGDWGSWSRHQAALQWVEYALHNASTHGYGATLNYSGDTVPTGHPVNYYIHNISGSLYLHWNAPADVNTAFTQLNQSLSTNGGCPGSGESNSVYQRIGWAQNLAASYGVKFSTYETGSELPTGSVATACDADARMRTLIYNMGHRFNFGGGGAASPQADAFVYFWLTGNAGLDTSLFSDFSSYQTQRWLAIQDLAAEYAAGGAPQVTVGSSGTVRTAPTVSVASSGTVRAQTLSVFAVNGISPADGASVSFPLDIQGFGTPGDEVRLYNDDTGTLLGTSVVSAAWNTWQVTISVGG